jgi:hypothetical protein
MRECWRWKNTSASSSGCKKIKKMADDTCSAPKPENPARGQTNEGMVNSTTLLPIPQAKGV